MTGARTRANREAYVEELSSTAAGIIRYFGEYDGPQVEVPQIPTSEDLTGMGPLVWMEVQLFDGRFEEWTFDPRPRIAYDTREQLWCVGGDFRFSSRGFRNTKYGTTPLTFPQVEAIRETSKYATMVDRYGEAHGGRLPTEAVSGYIEIPKRPVALAYLHALAYRNNKGNGAGLVNWRHSFLEDAKQPVLGTSPQGDTLAILGGDYGIRRGWII